MEEFEYLDGRKVANILRRKYQFIRRIRIDGTLQRIYVKYEDVKKVKNMAIEGLVSLWRNDVKNAS